MVEFLGALHKPYMMRTSRDIGGIVKKGALVVQVIAFNYMGYKNLDLLLLYLL